jgi:hypothetical protein
MTCGTDFDHTQCGTGETLMGATVCPIGGCTTETCCAKKTCAAFACTGTWIDQTNKASKTCKKTGCDDVTCCMQQNCALDFKNEQGALGSCGQGELLADPHTVCPRGGCNSNVCCTRKVCATAFSCSALGADKGLVPASKGTLCNRVGCDSATCCVTATCGTHFAGCGPWTDALPAGTLCPNGQCDASVCCKKWDCLIHKSECNAASIKEITHFDAYKFPNANVDPLTAMKACSSLDRGECFATMDDGCDGKNLRMCVPKRANDPYSLVLTPSTSACVCYKPEASTCGYNMQGTCSGGQKVNFFKECGKACTTAACCEALTCADDFRGGCGISGKLLGTATCPPAGCDAATCCSQMTCGTDWAGTCPRGTTAQPPTTVCTTGVCHHGVCCSAIEITRVVTPAPPTTCETGFRGTCGKMFTFNPTPTCDKAGYRLGQ